MPVIDDELYKRVCVICKITYELEAMVKTHAGLICLDCYYANIEDY